MKKLLLLAGVVAISCSVPVFANEAVQTTQPVQQRPCPIERCQKPGSEFAHPERMHRPPCFDMKKFEEELNLTDKQKEQVKALREKQMEAAKPIFEQLKQKDKEVLELRQQLREQRIQDKKEFEAILTDKQLKKFEKLKQEHRQEFAKRHKAGMHKRPPMPIPCECNCGCKKK